VSQEPAIPLLIGDPRDGCAMVLTRNLKRFDGPPLSANLARGTKNRLNMGFMAHLRGAPERIRTSDLRFRGGRQGSDLRCRCWSPIPPGRARPAGRPEGR